MKVFISGQKYFAERVFDICKSFPEIEIVGVCCPIDDKYLGDSARRWGIPIIPAGMLNGDNFPDGVDLGISAHSFDYVGKKTRYKPRLGWIGYHPSLLPRHRGRSSIEWAIRMRDAITGGTIFWLNSGIDRGDVMIQDWCFIDPKLYSQDPKRAAGELWRDELLPMGQALIEKAIGLILYEAGERIRFPQDSRFSTWEPSTDVKDIYRPDALLLNQKND